MNGWQNKWMAKINGSGSFIDVDHSRLSPILVANLDTVKKLYYTDVFRENLLAVHDSPPPGGQFMAE